ncbi:DUF362 domain-containing protein [Candidatus Bathyarchaeota archaeon]|nr:DUF362 domain-containing protein [Candidatus Bathyarchaeota archaeon]
MSKVAIVEFNGNVYESLAEALKLINNIDDLNTKKRTVTIKVGVFDPKSEAHSTVDVVDAIIKSFTKAPEIFVAESDNYRGTGSERLQIWKNLFNERVKPFNLSEDAEVKKVKIADEEISFSHILFKPNVLVSTHIARGYEKGSILKNLLGLIPDRKKARFHKKLETTLLDAFEAIGGIDLAVLDGTHAFAGTGIGEKGVQMNTLLVGRDAVAVETVGATLAGLNPKEMPIIQKAVERGLGEGELDNIKIVGASFDSVKKKFASALTPKKGKRTA